MRTFLILLLVLAGAALAALETGIADKYVDMDRIPVEPFLKAELRDKASPEGLSVRIIEALDAERYDDAEMYAELANYLNMSLSDEARNALDHARRPEARLGRQAGSFFEGFLTGEGSDSASFAGAIASDMTVVGDIRDISAEGSKMVVSEPYSEVILGLSVVGLAATTATVATGGAGLPVRIGVSLLKVARKAGMLTASFSRELRRLVVEAVNFPALRETLQTVSPGDMAATRQAVAAYAGNVRGARLFPVLEQMDRLRQNVGPAESVRLMKYVKSTDDLEQVVKMSATLGVKTRGVMAITGKTGLRAFKSAVNLVRILLDYILEVLGAVVAFFAVMFGRRVVRRRRA